MESNLHMKMLALWDKAVGKLGYDKREWQALQAEILDLEARVRILRATLADTLRETLVEEE